MNLSRNFTLQELIKSDTAIRLNIDNNPNGDQIDKLKQLCENVLQPVRDQFGRVKVTSGFRSPELCRAIGSSQKIHSMQKQKPLISNVLELTMLN